MYALVFLGMGAGALWVAFSPHGLRLQPLGFLAFAVAACLALALFWGWMAQTGQVRQSAGSRHRRGLISLFLQGALFMILAANAFALLHYLALSLGIAYADGLLHGWDRALGLDWAAYAGLFAGNPLWPVLYLHAQIPVVPACVLALAALLLLDQAERARRFLVCLTLTALACICAAVLLPVRGAVSQIGVAEASALLAAFQDIGPWPGHSRIDMMDGLRAGAPLRIDLGEARGVAAFSSFHAIAALVFAWHCRGLPLFWPAAVFAAANLAAMPVWSGHYFVDAVAAAIVAAGVCLGVAHFPRREENRRRGAGEACNPGRQTPPC